MKIGSVLKQHKILVALCASIFSVTVVPAHGVKQDPTAGPAIGKTIDLTSFRSRSGRTLAEAMKQHSLAMVVLVDPNCAGCTETSAALRALRERVQTTRIAYHVIMIPDGSETQKYFEFADSLKIQAESFVWSNAQAKPPASLLTMTKPSHLHVTPEGVIVKMWSGIPEKDSAP